MRDWCDDCDAVLREKGVIGACPHDFPGRPRRAYWTKRCEDGVLPSYRIAVTLAVSYQQAGEFFGESRLGRVHTLYEGPGLWACIGLDGRAVREIDVDALPLSGGDWN